MQESLKFGKIGRKDSKCCHMDVIQKQFVWQHLLLSHFIYAILKKTYKKQEKHRKDEKLNKRKSCKTYAGICSSGVSGKHFPVVLQSGRYQNCRQCSGRNFAGCCRRHYGCQHIAYRLFTGTDQWICHCSGSEFRLWKDRTA